MHLTGVTTLEVQISVELNTTAFPQVGISLWMRYE